MRQNRKDVDPHDPLFVRLPRDLSVRLDLELVRRRCVLGRRVSRAEFIAELLTAALPVGSMDALKQAAGA
jgi:hypothetical protein